jgi:transposase
MATLEQFKMSLEQKKRRTFSNKFKLKKVKEIEQKKTTVHQVSEAYCVTAVSVYKWIEKYGEQKNKVERVIVEDQSDTTKILSYERKIAELERIVGQKQVLIDFQWKIIELAEEEYGIDIKKKLNKEP